jgi:hypothetical protein
MREVGKEKEIGLQPGTVAIERYIKVEQVVFL